MQEPLDPDEVTTQSAAVRAGSEDPPGEAPWAMQLVMRLEKSESQPPRAAICAAAAMATVRLLADERAAPDGPWHPAIARWWDGRIRKHARRARGANWERAQLLDGVTVAHAGAEVRAFVPSSTAEIPPDIAKLQLSGSEVEAVGPPEVDPVPDGPLVVSITAEPEIGLGKAAAAAAHAAQLAWMQMSEQRRARWAKDGYPVLVEHPAVARWRAQRDVDPVVIRDGGFTEVEPGTVTATARWVD